MSGGGSRDNFTAAENSGVDAVSSASYSVVDGTPVGRLRAVADMIQDNTGGDLFSIQTSVVYPADGGELIDYAAQEQNDNARPELTSHIENLDQYDVIFIGYPNWWYDMPMAMYSFFDEYDFSGKTIIPFNVHNGSQFSGTIRTIQELEPDAVVIEDGFTINERDVADAAKDVKDWLSSISLFTDNRQGEAAAAVGSEAETETEMTDNENKSISGAKFPSELMEIPQEYFSDSMQQGTLVELSYDTYESMSYEQKTTALHKRAIVYLPYGYSEDTQYNVFYLMHGGWSNETTYLGVPGRPSGFKNVLDHAMEDGKIQPMIVVCPTYNNTSESDSSDYSLALRLTENYHNELINDLIPAVEGTYSTYAQETTPEGLKASRDHRAFCGFSMGSVATWRTFQYCLDYFRYFMPSSGSITSDGEYMASMVSDSGHEWNDFFIFAASGTDDFAYSSFKNQIETMADVRDKTFRYADNETEGNLYFLEKEGATHSGEAAIEYFYNGLCCIWR